MPISPSAAAHAPAPGPKSPQASAEPKAKDASYVLGVGALGFDRLEVSEEAYGQATPELVDILRQTEPPMWPQGPIEMAVVACGSGSQLPSLSRIVGTDGGLICSDISQAQLDCAQAHAVKLGLDKVSFHTLDITQTPAPKQYDVVYARFVLVHLQEPHTALRHMWQMVRPGGLLLSEEHNAAALTCHPPCPAVDIAKDLLLALGHKRGVHYDLGRSAKTIFEQAQVPMGGTTRHNFSFVHGPPKTLFEMSIREGASHYIGAGLIDEAHMQSLLAELGAFNKRPDTRMFLGEFVQSWTQKPAAPFV